jgi:pathogenesis-related protein 1
MPSMRRIPLALLLVAFACKTDRPERSTPPDAAASPPTDTSSAAAEPPPPRKSKRGEPRPASKRGDPEDGRLAGITAAHNRVRAPLGLPPLEWSDELARFAQTWADKLERRGCDLQHRPRSGPDKQRYGENLFGSTGSTPTSGDVVDAWAAEVSGYNPKTNRCKGVCGHYTQIVWRASTRVGCAMAACGDSEVWVCNYDPPGNFLGQKPY